MPDKPGKRQKAIALRYEAGSDRAPKVVGTGAGEIARRIIEIAEEQGIPIKQDVALTEALSRLELAQEIPQDLFNAVAEVLVWAYGLEKKGGA